MCRVREGRVTKPSVPGGAAQPRRRGRPAIDWTRSRKRRLLRLYLCTPESGLSLKKILKLLADGPFQPKPRHTQCLLNDMLSKSYRQKRPRNRTTMGERLAYLRSIRDGKRQKERHTTPPRREVVKECAILLKANPGGPKTNTQLSGEPEDFLDSLGSPVDQRPDTSSNPSSRCLDLGEPRDSLEKEDLDEEVPSPTIFRNPWSASEDSRYEKIEFLRERCPSRSSSFLADVASLLSGLSIQSSLSRSSSGSSRRSIRSDPARVKPSGSVLHADRGTERASTAVSTTDSGAWSGDVAISPVPMGFASLSSQAWTGQKAKDSYQAGSSSHTQENHELVRFCCSKTAWCIHQRINDVLMHGSPTETFACTTAEADCRDGLGNTTLHVAARWGAPCAVLFRIMTLASHPSVVNQRGETFLHVLDPTSLVPEELAELTKYLVSRDFHFLQLDGTGQSFIDRLVSRPSFSLASVEAIFSHLSERDRLALYHLHHPGPQQLIHAIRARLLLSDHPNQTEASAAAYCTYFSTRYATSHRPVWITPTLLCHIPHPQPPSRNLLHQLVAAVNVGRAMRPPTTHDLCLNAGRTTLPFVQALSLALDTYSSDEDVNNREQGTLHTPLVTLLRGLSWGNYTENAMAQTVGLMLARGARPGVRDAEGNTALHWAARLGLLGPVVMFCDCEPGLGSALNARGKTARELAVEGMERAEGRVVGGASGGVARYAEVVLFLETGVVAGDMMRLRR
ncbi:hypothetical protein C8A03DRAFT_31188 [Achaetomium macrosporum]|uniref:Ankyrin n=1 Tax=Achaetomium macrosporum TaxID=79813 RepID=A0AAN7CH02_9PEZI|nr:hypothetical protein C8A03DRAFT_31188 [Achaetomium macrosporum]